MLIDVTGEYSLFLPIKIALVVCNKDNKKTFTLANFINLTDNNFSTLLSPEKSILTINSGNKKQNIALGTDKTKVSKIAFNVFLFINFLSFSADI